MMSSGQKNPDSGESQPLTARYTPSSLELKLKRQRNRLRMKKVVASGGDTQTVISSAPKKTSLLSVTRLQIPSNNGYQKIDNSPLVDLESDSDGEFTSLFAYEKSTASEVNMQLSRQLEKDGFRLDEIPDDEDLDLIPPSDFRDHQYCSCCNAHNVSCIIL